MLATELLGSTGHHLNKYLWTIIKSQGSKRELFSYAMRYCSLFLVRVILFIIALFHPVWFDQNG